MTRFFLFNRDQIWIRRSADGRVECLFDTAPGDASLTEAVDAATGAAATDQPPVPGAETIGLRALFDLIPEALSSQAGLARQLLYWRETHRFCGCCAQPLRRHPTERAMVCDACGLYAYPRINPVVITLVHRNGQLLLVHKAGGLYPFWSLVAGFVEANESLEAAVAREIKEEVGLEVKNIRYASSQPWPYPNNLMLGFTAEYAAGAIVPDGEEIGQADWFDRHTLPPIPSRVSIARRLIDDFFSNSSFKATVA